MKKFTLQMMLLVTVCTTAFPQSIKNTTWYVYDPSNVLTYYFHFETDTLQISLDLNSYFPLSIFSENGNTLTLNDIPGVSFGCSPGITGNYTFSMQNDTVFFNLISDLCSQRAGVMTTHHWVRAETMLHNTYWDIYSPSNVLTYRCHYGTDLGYMSTDLITFNPITNFYENGNELTLIDINGAPMACPSTDIGQYTFSIQNDTLFLAVVSDICLGRVQVNTLYHWVRNTTGIETPTSYQKIEIFPNPSPDGIYNLIFENAGLKYNKISITTPEGKLISEEIISENGIVEQDVNLSEKPSGLYLLTIQGKQGSKTFKLIR